VNRAWGPNWLLAKVELTTQEYPEGEGILVGPLPELALVPVFTAEAVVHGGAFSPGAIAPGEIISIFGKNLSLKEESRLTWEGPLSLADEINGVRVLFGGMPGTMLYAGPNQINVVAPETIASLTEVEIQVIRYGIPSARVRKAVVTARPGLFAYSTAGRRYAAALHIDGRLQGPTTPLERGKPVSLFGTGLGLPIKLTADRIADRAAETPVRPTVTIGGRPATVLYSGVSPGLTAGLAQINVVVPLDAPVGSAVEVVIEANGRSERNTWLAVQ
jgi:uncharacterized protein (TIGR03437 family)